MLSVIFLTNNDEEIIADSLDSVREVAGELIVVDSGSADRTVDISQHMGAKVYSHEFKNFADQRNFALQKTHGEWVLYLDSDERATPEFVKEIKFVIESKSNLQHQTPAYPGTRVNIGGYFIRRKTFYLGKEWGFTDCVQRLFKREMFVEWQGVVHETPKIKGEFGVISCPILHFTHRNISQMVAKTNVWSEYEADLRMKARHPRMSVWRFIRVMITGFWKSYISEKGYQNGTEGMIEGIYQAFSMFVTYAKLWEKQQHT